MMTFERKVFALYFVAMVMLFAAYISDDIAWLCGSAFAMILALNERLGKLEEQNENK